MCLSRSLPPFVEFSEAIKKADAHHERSCVRNLNKAGRRPRNWQANAWMLERKHPQRWGRVERKEIHRTTDEPKKLPEQIMNAISQALGIRGPFRPLVNGVEVSQEVWEQREAQRRQAEQQQQRRNGNGTERSALEPDDDVKGLLPAPSDGSNGSNGDLDSGDELPILP